jgi:hypothetical protein
LPEAGQQGGHTAEGIGRIYNFYATEESVNGPGKGKEESGKENRSGKTSSSLEVATVRKHLKQMES